MKKVLDKISFRIKLILEKFKVLPDISEKREIIEYYRELFAPKIMVETGNFMGGQ